MHNDFHAERWGPVTKEEPPPELITKSTVQSLIGTALAEERKRWTSHDKVTAGIAGVALVAAALSAYFSWSSSNTAIDNLEQSNQRTRYEAVSAKLLDRDSTLVEHSDLIPYFWGTSAGPVPTSPKDPPLVRAIATERVNFDDYAYTELWSIDGAMPDGPDKGKFVQEGPHTDWSGWSAMFINDFTRSPAMCDAVIGAKDTYNPHFINALVQANACPELEQ